MTPTPKQRAIRLVQAGMTIREVAEDLGLNESALRAWLDQAQRGERGELELADKIRTLLGHEDPAIQQQGAELLRALADDEVFDSVLKGWTLRSGRLRGPGSVWRLNAGRLMAFFLRPSADFSQLTNLDLSYNLHLENVDGLADLTALTALDLRHCRSLRNVDGLANLTGLQTLSLAHCELLKDVTGLAGLAGLTTLDLSFCSLLSNVDDLAHLTGLQALSLAECESLKDVTGLAELTELTALTLAECTSLSNVDVLARLTSLQSLSLADCTSVRNVDALAALSSLRTLYLNECPAMANLPQALRDRRDAGQLDIQGRFLGYL